MKESSKRIVKLALSSIAFIQLGGCFWYYVSTFSLGEINARCLGATVDGQERCWHCSGEVEGSRCSWVVADGTADLSIYIRYARSVYWAAITFTTTGYGDIGARSFSECIYAFFWLYVSTFLYYSGTGGFAAAIQKRQRVNTLCHSLNFLPDMRCCFILIVTSF